jgi:GTPase SAR1 family protein
LATAEDKLLLELRALRSVLASGSAPRKPRKSAAALRALRRIEEAVARPIRVAVLGEGSSGKSLLINYLLKHQVLPSGSFSGDSTELLIRYAPEPSVHAVRPDGSRNRLTSKAFGRLVKPDQGAPAANRNVIYDATERTRQTAFEPFGAGMLSQGKAVPTRLIEVGLPLAFLRQVEIIEVRGFPEERVGAPSADAFRQVDLAMWCTLATQAWKETEAAAWRRIPPGRRKRALMLVTYRDAVRSEADETKMLTRLRHAGARLFDDVIILSLRDALQALLTPDAEAARTLHAKSNVSAAEAAMSRLIEDWRRRRFDKAGELLLRIAETLRSGDDGGPEPEIAARLHVLSAEFLNASPSISLNEQAA